MFGWKCVEIAISKDSFLLTVMKKHVPKEFLEGIKEEPMIMKLQSREDSKLIEMKLFLFQNISNKEAYTTV